MNEPGESAQPSARSGVLRTPGRRNRSPRGRLRLRFPAPRLRPAGGDHRRGNGQDEPTPGPSPAIHAPAAPTPAPARAPASAVAEPGPSRAQGRPRAPEPGADVWAAAVSDGLSALDRGSLAEARELRARGGRSPGTPAVRDGLSAPQAAQKDASLAEHRSRALRAEAAEDWSVARTSTRPRRSSTPPWPLRSKAGRGPRSAGPRRTPRGLPEAARTARRPRRWRVRPRPSSIAPPRSSSPGRGSRGRWPRCARPSRRHDRRRGAPRLRRPHDVSVLRVGRLGVFKEKTLQLRPGSYVVVGTRKGYPTRASSSRWPPVGPRRRCACAAKRPCEARTRS